MNPEQLAAAIAEIVKGASFPVGIVAIVGMDDKCTSVYSISNDLPIPAVVAQLASVQYKLILNENIPQ